MRADLTPRIPVQLLQEELHSSTVQRYDIAQRVWVLPWLPWRRTGALTLVEVVRTILVVDQRDARLGRRQIT